MARGNPAVIPPAQPTGEQNVDEPQQQQQEEQEQPIVIDGVAGDAPVAQEEVESSESGSSVSSSAGSSSGADNDNDDDESDDSPAKDDSASVSSDSDDVNITINKFAPEEQRRVPLLETFPTQLSADFMSPWLADDVVSNSGSSLSSYSEESLCDSCGCCDRRKTRRTTLTVSTRPLTRVVLSDLNWDAAEFTPGREQHRFKYEPDHRRHRHSSSSSTRSVEDEPTPVRSGAERCFDPMGGGEGFHPAGGPVDRGQTQDKGKGKCSKEKRRLLSGGDAQKTRSRTVSFATSEDDTLSTPPPIARVPSPGCLNPIFVTSMLNEDALLPLDDHVIVTWDVEASGLTLSAEIMEIGAFCPGVGKFNEFIMPNREIPRQVSEIHDLWLLKHPCPRFASEGANIGLYRKSTGKNLDAKYRKEVMAKFVAFLRSCSRNASVLTAGRIPVGSKIILLSHGGRGIDIPLLLQALQRYPVIEAEFFKLVDGFGDSLPFLQDHFSDSREEDCPASLGEIGQLLLGRGRGDGDLAADDAEMLYRVVQQVSDSDMVEHKHIQQHAYTLAAMKDDLANRRIRALKTLTLHPIFGAWLMHPDARVRVMIREMRATLVAADCQRRYVEKAFWEGKCPCVIAYVRRLLWRLKKLTDQVAKVLLEKRLARLGKDDVRSVDEERADGGGCASKKVGLADGLGSDGEEQGTEESDEESQKGDEHQDCCGSRAFDDGQSDKGDNEEDYRHLSKKEKLALAMQGSSFTWRQLKTVIMFYVKCISVDYTPTADDIKGFHYD